MHKITFFAISVGMFAACALVFGALSTTSFGYEVNKDLKNLGAAASDLTVVLSGTENVASHFDGYTSGTLQGRFKSFATGPSGANTEMKWDNFVDGGNNQIDTNQTIHVGWSTSDNSSNVKDMFWTDATGQRMSGIAIFNITSGWRYNTATEILTLEFENIFVSSPFSGLQTIDIEIVMLELTSVNPIDILPLEDLNSQRPC